MMFKLPGERLMHYRADFGVDEDRSLDIWDIAEQLDAAKVRKAALKQALEKLLEERRKEDAARTERIRRAKQRREEIIRRAQEEIEKRDTELTFALMEIQQYLSGFGFYMCDKMGEARRNRLSQSAERTWELKKERKANENH